VGSTVFAARSAGVQIASASSAASSKRYGAALLATRAAESAAQAAPTTTATSYAPDELLVTYKPSLSASARSMASGNAAATRSPATAQRVQSDVRRALAEAAASAMVRTVGVSPAILTARVRVRDGVSMEEAIRRLRADPRVASVERNGMVERTAVAESALAQRLQWARSMPQISVRALGGRSLEARLAAGRFRFDLDDAFPVPGFYPATARFAEQAWHYNAVRLPQAWQITQGSPDVIVAVVDDGIHFDHPAMAGRLTDDGYDFVGEFRVRRCNGASDSNTGDGDGYDADPTNPVDWNLGSSSCLASIKTSGNHGLHVAATIAASPGSGSGLVGGSFTTRIRPVRALGIIGGFVYDIAQAILYAAGLPADDGAGGTVVPSGGPAHIINMSFGGSSNSEVRHAAVRQAEAQGILLIASAGNSNNSTPQYPAAYPEVISVSAVGPTLQRATYSSFGPTVEIAAPGGQVSLGASYGVRSATWNHVTNEARTDSWNGTSMAAPHVSAVAALLKSQFPNMTGPELRARLTSTATDIGAPGVDQLYGAGLVNAERALRGDPARSTYVVLVNAQTGAEVARTATDASGAFRFDALSDGRYWLFAGTDEDGDGVLGLANRAWGAAGGASAPTVYEVDGAGEYPASFTLQPATELEPNNESPQSNLLLPGGNMRGTISALNDFDQFTLRIAEAGSYRITVTGQEGACGYALETDPVLTLFSADNAELGVIDDVDAGALNYCASLTRTLAPGDYRAQVQGLTTGRYLIRAVRLP
jgi:subtilisin family serine protease